MSKPSEYDRIVPADKMPPCPICGRAIKVPAETAADRLRGAADGESGIRGERRT